MKTKAVVFDLFGTLLYLAQETKPYAHLFKEMGLQTPEELRLARKIAITENFDDLSELVERIKPGLQMDTTIYRQEVEKERATATCYPETTKVLDRLRERDLKLGLISNLASPYKKPFFELGLDKYFQEVIFSCDIGLRKPDPQIYQKMVDNLKVNPHYIFMTGDKIHADVDGPKLIGMKAMHLDRKSSSEHSIMTLEGIFQYL